MKSISSPQRRFAALASDQFGQVSRAQLVGLGFTENQIRSLKERGELIPVLPRTYSLASASQTWEGKLMAVVLWAGPPAVVTHRAAARLHGFPNSQLSFCEISVPTDLRVTNPFVVVHRSQPWEKRWLTRVGPFRVTNAAATLVDLASVIDADTLEHTLDHVLRRQLSGCKHIPAALDARPANSGGVAVLRNLVEDRIGRAVSESVLETKVHRLILGSGLPPPSRQLEVFENGRVIARLDLAYPDVRLAVECDGYEFHSAKKAWGKDKHRENRLTALGWRILHVTWADLSNPHEWLSQLGRALSDSVPGSESNWDETAGPQLSPKRFVLG